MKKLYNTVYLAGSIKHEIRKMEDKECVDWREDWQEKLEKAGYRVLSPMRKKKRPYDYKPRLCHRDLMDIEKADFVLVNYLRPSDGTAFEMCYARFVANTEVIVVNNSGLKEEDLSFFILNYAGDIVNTFEEALKILDWYQIESKLPKGVEEICEGMKRLEERGWM